MRVYVRLEGETKRLAARQPDSAWHRAQQGTVAAILVVSIVLLLSPDIHCRHDKQHVWLLRLQWSWKVH